MVNRPDYEGGRGRVRDSHLRQANACVKPKSSKKHKIEIKIEIDVHERIAGC